MQRSSSLAACGILMALGCTAAFGQGAPAPPVSRFDGGWNITVDCPSNSEPSGAKGYAYRLSGTVQDGLLVASQGTPDAPGSLRIEGPIRPDGSADLRARGRTGDPDYAVKHPSSGTAYWYRIKAQFDEAKGTGTRMEARVCNIVFAKR